MDSMFGRRLSSILSFRSAVQRQPNQTLIAIALSLLMFAGGSSRAAAQFFRFQCDASTDCSATDHGGLIMPSPSIVLVFWLPAGFHFDAGGPVGDTAYQTLIKRFFTDVSPSTYYNILSEYPGICSSTNPPPPTPCFGPISSVMSELDMNPYPHAGTQAAPVTDIDIHAELMSEIAKNKWPTGLGVEYFVFLGRGVEQCDAAINTCTFDKGGDTPLPYCAYHDNFVDSNGNTVVYAVMPSVDALGSGCDPGIPMSPNSLISADKEIAAASHEFFESMTDPLNGGDAMSVAWGNDRWGEIGDTCVGMLGSFRGDGSNIMLNGNPYDVQEIWSNNFDACILNEGRGVAGVTIENTMVTLNDDLRDNSNLGGVVTSQDGSSQGIFSKSGPPGWAQGSTHVRVNSYTLSTPLNQEVFTLTSHPDAVESPDTWQIGFLDMRMRNPNGTLLCEQSAIKVPLPLATLTDGAPFTFLTPNCVPPPPADKAVECFVFDDGKMSEVGPSDAIFISGMGKACIPDGTATGTCRKWFGECRTVKTHEPVSFQLFDDGPVNIVGPANAVYVPAGGDKACLPDGTPTGTCRRWFGLAKAGADSVLCEVFDDGYTRPTLPKGAIYVPHPIPAVGAACIPDGTATGTCRKWWGRCAIQ